MAAALRTRTYTGLVTRAIAFAFDIVAINAIAGIVAGLLALVMRALPGGAHTDRLVALIAFGVYVIWYGAYFVAFWSTTGQTLGAHVMRFAVHDRATGAPPHVARSIVRLIGVVLAAIPLLLGFLPIVFDDRRRGLQDWLAGTVVVDTDSTPSMP